MCPDDWHGKKKGGGAGMNHAFSPEIMRSMKIYTRLTEKVLLTMLY